MQLLRGSTCLFQVGQLFFGGSILVVIGVTESGQRMVLGLQAGD